MFLIMPNIIILENTITNAMLTIHPFKYYKLQLLSQLQSIL